VKFSLLAVVQRDVTLIRRTLTLMQSKVTPTQCQLTLKHCHLAIVQRGVTLIRSTITVVQSHVAVKHFIVTMKKFKVNVEKSCDYVRKTKKTLKTRINIKFYNLLRQMMAHDNLIKRFVSFISRSSQACIHQCFQRLTFLDLYHHCL